jgi:site-specific DNA-adenine methylase
MRKFAQSPLPFQGQKRKFTKEFAIALEKYPSNGVYIDLFGGSGLLSHTVKMVYPDARVVYNDFDGFRNRIEAIPKTNKLLADLRFILADCGRDQKILNGHKMKVIELLTAADRAGYVDWITLSSSLKFAMNYGSCLKDFVNDTLYNKVRMSDYDASGYLEGVEVVCTNYRDLYGRHRDVEKVVFLVDPPYLSTDTATYGSNGYWKLKDYLDVLQVISDRDYFYFTSNKSQIVELCEWISSVSATANPFEGAYKTTVSTTTSYNSGYVDIMYHYRKK